jgi:hypothetical protein
MRLLSMPRDIFPDAEKIHYVQQMLQVSHSLGEKQECTIEMRPVFRLLWPGEQCGELGQHLSLTAEILSTLPCPIEIDSIQIDLGTERPNDLNESLEPYEEERPREYAQLLELKRKNVQLNPGKTAVTFEALVCCVVLCCLQLP